MPGVSRFSRVEDPYMPGSSTAQSPDVARLSAAPDVAFRQRNTVGTLDERRFRSSIPGLHVPLSTLRWLPCGDTTHDSGSGWWARPFLCDAFIHTSHAGLSRRTSFCPLHSFRQ